MKLLALFTSMFISSSLLAHPSGLYVIDGDKSVTVDFSYIGKCPTVPGSLSGGLRKLTFSKNAEQSPYDFSTGFFVEKHDSNGEVYIETNNQCVSIERGQRIRASKRTFGGFSLKRIR